MAGMFITFEGPEASGKSTQLRLLAKRLEKQGIQAVCVREPGGTAVGEVLRTLLQHDIEGGSPTNRSELLLFAASRTQLMKQIVLPALEKGEWVLCDRFIDSTVAYQGFARKLDISVINMINEFAIYGRKPDITLLLDIEIEVGFQRIDERDAPLYAKSGGALDRFEREARGFHRRVREGYLQLAAREQRFRLIDSNKPVNAVASAIWAVVKESL